MADTSSLLSEQVAVRHPQLPRIGDWVIPYGLPGSIGRITDICDVTEAGIIVLISWSEREDDWNWAYWHRLYTTVEYGKMWETRQAKLKPGPVEIVITEGLRRWSVAFAAAFKDPRIAMAGLSDLNKALRAYAAANEAVPLAPDDRKVVFQLVAERRLEVLAVGYGTPEVRWSDLAPYFYAERGLLAWPSLL